MRLGFFVIGNVTPSGAMYLRPHRINQRARLERATLSPHLDAAFIFATRAHAAIALDEVRRSSPWADELEVIELAAAGSIGLEHAREHVLDAARALVRELRKDPDRDRPRVRELADELIGTAFGLDGAESLGAPYLRPHDATGAGLRVATHHHEGRSHEQAEADAEGGALELALEHARAARIDAGEHVLDDASIVRIDGDASTDSTWGAWKRANETITGAELVALELELVRVGRHDEPAGASASWSLELVRKIERGVIVGCIACGGGTAKKRNATCPVCDPSGEE